MEQMTMHKREKVSFTRHAIDRFKERFGNLIVDGEVIKTLARLFYTAEPEKSIQNNTRLMVEFYEKYGYDDDISFSINGDVVFVCRNNTLVTVYPKDGNILFDTQTSRFKK